MLIFTVQWSGDSGGTRNDNFFGRLVEHVGDNGDVVVVGQVVEKGVEGHGVEEDLSDGEIACRERAERETFQRRGLEGYC